MECLDMLSIPLFWRIFPKHLSVAKGLTYFVVGVKFVDRVTYYALDDDGI